MTFQFKLPDIGEGVHEGEIVKWHVAVGDNIAEDAPMVDVMTDKVTVEITSPVSGVVETIAFAEGQVAKVGDVIVSIQKGATSNGSAQKAPEKAAAEKTTDVSTSPPQNTLKAATAVLDSTARASAVSNEKVLAPPAVRKLAKEIGVPLETVSGSGEKGRVRIDDVIAAARAGTMTSGQAKKPHVIRQDITQPFRGIRRKIGEHLTKSKHTAPHFTYVDDVDMTAVVQARGQLKALAQASNVKLTFLPFVIKAVIQGLKKYPILNSTLDEANEQIVLKGAYNIGIAMATEQGLVVPVIHNADQYNLFELATQIELLAKQAQANKLPLEAMQGGTFTLTSIGSIGGLFSAPIINFPEVAIMGIHKVEKRPVVRDDDIVIRSMTYLSISCDHRVVDGADAAVFMNEVKLWLEEPFKMLADL